MHKFQTTSNNHYFYHSAIYAHVNKRYLSSTPRKVKRCPKLISWKHSFKRLNEEYELANKKKNALDNLYETGRISQSTRDSFNNDIVTAITEIEKQQKDLLAKMEAKVNELQSNIKTLEMLLANYEIQHVVGEIDEDTYQHEITLLGTGLETTKHELETIKEAATQLCPPSPAVAMEPPAATPPPPTEVVAPTPEPEVAPTPPIEAAPAPETPAEVETIPPLCPQENITNIPEPTPEQAPMENTEAAPTESPPESIAEPITESIVEPSEQAPIENPPENTEENAAETETATEDIVQPILENPIEPENIQPETIQTPTTEEQIPPENVIIVEEATQEAHPHIAPKEAQQEITIEAATENTENTEESHPAAEASTEENSEKQNS